MSIQFEGELRNIRDGVGPKILMNSLLYLLSRNVRQIIHVQG